MNDLISLVRHNGELKVDGRNSRMKILLEKLDMEERRAMEQYIMRRGWVPIEREPGRWRKDEAPYVYMTAGLESAYELELQQELAN